MSAAEKLNPPEDAPAEQPKPRASHLAKHSWKPGQSGNPAGKPKRIGQLRAISLDVFPEAVERLKQLINSKDEQMAFQAVQFAYVYALGKPSEAHQLAHIEAMLAKTQEILIEHPPQEQLVAAVTHDAGKEVVPERTAVVPEAASESIEPPASAPPLPVETAKPHAMRCIYRGESGQCEALAADGVSWCGPHKAKLFEALK